MLETETLMLEKRKHEKRVSMKFSLRNENKYLKFFRRELGIKIKVMYIYPG